MPPEVHTSRPADERAGATGPRSNPDRMAGATAGTLTGTLLNPTDGAGVEAAPSDPTPPLFGHARPAVDVIARADHDRVVAELAAVRADRDRLQREIEPLRGLLVAVGHYRDAYHDAARLGTVFAETRARNALFRHLDTIRDAAERGER